MSAAQLTAEIMALPLPERATLAKSIWQSLSECLPDSDEQSAIADALRRDNELSSSRVEDRDNDQVMAAARKAILCGYYFIPKLRPR